MKSRILAIWPSGRYFFIRMKMRLKKSFYKKENQYLFLLSPPFSGSTLVHEILSTSKNVSSNNPFFTREGQSLPKVKQWMFNQRSKWDSKIDLPYEKIKAEWEKYWDPSKLIWLEKSPPNLMHTPQIVKQFSPLKFLLLIRNPFALAEGMMRRSKMNPAQAANFINQIFKKVYEVLRDHPESLLLTYEEVTASPERAKDKILKWLPELGDITLDKKFNADNTSKKSLEIKNFNRESFERISTKDREDLKMIFLKNETIFQKFGYDLAKFIGD